MGPRGSPEDPKVTALRESRCLNAHPEQVSDPTFLAEELFDARDVVQVKYEMIRRVSVDGDSVTTAAAAFGLLPALLLRRGRRPGAIRAGRAGPGQARPARRAQAHRRGAGLGRTAVGRRSRLAPGRAGRIHRRTVRGPRAPPLGRTRAGPPAGAVQKPLTQPPTIPGTRRPQPCPYDHHLATRLLTRADHPASRMPARTLPSPGWTPATNTFVMPSCTTGPAPSPSASQC